MNAWDTVLGQRTLESIQSMEHDISKIKDNTPTLRDYFAAQFINGWCSNLCKIPDTSGMVFIAENAYEMADAMLEVRKNK